MRRRSLQLGLLLLAGAAVNMAVAWGCVAFAPFVFSTTKWDKNLPQANRDDFRWLAVAQYKTPSGAAVLYSLGTGFGIETRMYMACVSSENSEPLWRLGDLQIVPVRTRAGWPFYSLHGGIVNHMGTVRRVDALELPDSLASKAHNADRRLPLAPLWPGFAINTLFYAAILWVLFIGPFKLRRRRRLRHGLCPACAYPVGVSEACTECGKPVQPRTGTGQAA
jgi:hypothetical protein